MDPDAQTPGSPFLSSLHNEPTHLSSAPQKKPVVYCMTLKLEYSFQVQGSKKHAQRTNPLKMQMPLTLISNIYTHTFTHANERDARQGLSLQHPAHDNHVRDASSSGVGWPPPPLLTRLGPSQSGAMGGLPGPSEARASSEFKSPYETA